MLRVVVVKLIASIALHPARLLARSVRCRSCPLDHHCRARLLARSPSSCTHTTTPHPAPHCSAKLFDDQHHSTKRIARRDFFRQARAAQVPQSEGSKSGFECERIAAIAETMIEFRPREGEANQLRAAGTVVRRIC
jgi:hypothetical protein